MILEIFIVHFDVANMMHSLPYKVEYAVGEQDCKKCDKKIRSSVLKIAIMMQVRNSYIFPFIKMTKNVHFQSEEDDCTYPEWYHQKCFFKTHLPKTEAVFCGFAKLRYADQLIIKKQLGKIRRLCAVAFNWIFLLVQSFFLFFYTRHR